MPERGLHPLLAGRWSPTVFDTADEVGAAEVELLLEAARWAPSAGNSQPWAFVVGRRGDATHRRLVRHLAGSAARWAPTAGLLVANLCHRLVEDTDWEYSEFALYDLGQAVAHLTVQARALDLHVRQFRAFDRAGVAAEFGVPAHWEVTTMAAVGRLPAGAADPGPVPETDRRRRAVDDLLWPTGGAGADRHGDRPAVPVFGGGTGPHSGIDLTSNRALHEVLDDPSAVSPHSVTDER